MTELAEFPVDDVTLDALSHALDARLSYDADGALTVVGADMTVTKLLDFLSGYDASKSAPMRDSDGYEVPGWSEYPEPIYHRDDVIRALIAEVRRLRNQ